MSTAPCRSRSPACHSLARAHARNVRTVKRQCAADARGCRYAVTVAVSARAALVVANMTATRKILCYCPRQRGRTVPLQVLQTQHGVDIFDGAMFGSS